MVQMLFFGPKGTVTPVHFDACDNAFCQLVGHKYLRLFAPCESEKLYPRGSEEGLRNNSRLEPEDLLAAEAGAYEGRFPMFEQADYQEVVLGPGDVLYLPARWWHFVKSLSTSISLAYHF